MPTENIFLFLAGGLCCSVTSFLIGSFFKKPKEVIKRIEYGLISGIGSIAICWLAVRYYPDQFEPFDAIPYSILIGFLGIGRVLEWIAKKYGIEATATSRQNEDENTK